MNKRSGFLKKLTSLITAAVFGGALLEVVVDVLRHGFPSSEATQPATPHEDGKHTSMTPVAKPLELHPGWSLPRPQNLPKPTYNPAVLALGLVFLAFGVLTSYYVSAVGALLFLIGLTKWIGELQHEH